MEHLTEKEAILLLKKYSHDHEEYEKVLKHSKAVQKTALRIAKDIPEADLEFIRSASLLHDIGRFEYRPKTKDAIKHGIAGAEILLKENLPKHAKVAEKHIGAGIKKEDIKKQGLPLPVKDYLPETIEEKVIAHADNLIFGTRESTFEEVKKRFREELGKIYEIRVESLKQDIDKLLKPKKDKTKNR